MVSGPLCNKASSAAKSVRHSPVFEMLCSATRLSARKLFAITSQSRGAVMRSVFVTIFFQSGSLGWGLGLDRDVGRRQQAIHGNCSCAANHQNGRSRQQEEVVLITFPFLCSRPVHPEAEVTMNHSNGHDHVAKDSKRRNSGEHSKDQTQSAEELRSDGQKCEYSRDVQHSREEIGRAHV